VSYQVFDLIAQAMLSTFGSNGTVLLVVIGFILFILLSIHAGRAAILMVIIPLLSTLAGVGLSEWIGIPSGMVWIALAVCLIGGVVLAGIFTALTQ